MILTGTMSDGQVAAIILAFTAIYMMVLLGSILVSYLLMALSLASLFAKVGIEPWIAWVPIYNYWKWLELGGQKGWYSLLMLIPYGSIVTGVFLIIGMYRTGIAFQRTGGFLVLGIFLPFVWAFILGSRNEVYRPELISYAGYGPPLVGYGAGGPVVPQQPVPYSVG